MTRRAHRHERQPGAQQSTKQGAHARLEVEPGRTAVSRPADATTCRCDHLPMRPPADATTCRCDHLPMRMERQCHPVIRFGACPNVLAIFPVVPASRCPAPARRCSPRRPGLGADMVFLDLEDAVAPLEKPAARDKIVKAINDQDWGETVLCVRVNAWDTEWTYRDVIAIVEGASRAARRAHAAEGADRGRGAGARHAAHADREDHRSRESRVGIEAQIETAQRPHQRRGDLRGASTGSRRSSSARPTSPRPPRCRCSPAACRSPSTRATTSTTCSRRSSWPVAPTVCR